MSALEPRASEEYQNLAHRLTAQLNQALAKNHYTFHVTVGEKTESEAATTYLLKLKSNDGELYEATIEIPVGTDVPSRIDAKCLLRDVEIDPLHEEKINGYLDVINQTYKASNTKYTVTRIQQQIDDETSFVYRVKGDVDGKTYKIKIERPVIKASDLPAVSETAAQV